MTLSSGIIDPSKSQKKVSTTAVDAVRPDGLNNLRIGLLENGKRNAANILDAVGRELADRYGSGALVPLKKVQFAMPMSDELVEQLQRECDLVVIGVGDCGSCSASAVADGVRLERLGLPSAVVCTEAFEATSRAMAEHEGDPDHPFVLTGHPVANLSDEQIQKRAGELASQVAQRLLAGRSASEVA